MYSSFEEFLEILDAGDSEIITHSRQDPRIAIAILIYSAVHADGRIKQEETKLYRYLLENYLSVSEDEFLMFEDSVKRLCDKPDSINSIIQVVRDMPKAKREEVLTLMRDISISDKEYHEVEVNLVFKVSKMLGLR